MIVQFGTSRFLQAHVDLFAWEARLAGQTPPEIVIVQVSDDPGRAARLPAFADPAGFPVILRGLEGGLATERRVQVKSVVGGLAARRDWSELKRLFVEQASYVVSNTGDTGFRIPEPDRRPPRDGVAPMSFCAILLALLHHRWLGGGPGLTVLPCELVSRNGSTLQGLVAGLAADWSLPSAFQDWLEHSCVWVDTLVDRIVSEPLHPAGAVAEPYALWAIERRPGLTLPFGHPAIQLTDDLQRFERLKLHILNLGHTWLAERWRAGGGPAEMTVRDAMADPALGGGLKTLYAREVLPGFQARGLGAAAPTYAETTLERFANPYLAHRLSDIFNDHDAKVEKRIGGFVRWVDDGGQAIAMPQLRSLAARRAETLT